jgi:hypothetical protein
MEGTHKAKFHSPPHYSPWFSAAAAMFPLLTPVSTYDILATYIILIVVSIVGTIGLLKQYPGLIQKNILTPKAVQKSLGKAGQKNGDAISNGSTLYRSQRGEPSN